MEALTHPREEPSNSAPAAAASPTWVLLKLNCDDTDGSSNSSVTGDAKTSSVICRTTTGWLIRISFLLAAPPAASSFHCTWVGDGPYDDEVPQIDVVAAHDDAVLFGMRIPDEGRGACTTDTFEYFLYNASTGSTRLPSLCPLPSCYMPGRYLRCRCCSAAPCPATCPAPRQPVQRFLCKANTGVLRRRGEDDDEVVVVQLEVAWGAPRDTAELCVLRFPGSCEWEDLKSLPIVRHDGASCRVDDDALMEPWKTDAVVPAGDRFMCWVDYFLGGVLLCDMADQITELLYLPLPVDSAERRHWWRDRTCMKSSRTLAGAGAAALRFVSVDCRCCCGGVGMTDCVCSPFAFVVTSWTVSLRTTTTGEPLTWVKNGVFNSTELWALPNYRSLPRMPMKHPVVSCDDPDVVCFSLSNNYRGSGNLDRREDERLWTVMVNTRSKTLLSVLPQETIIWGVTHVPAKLSIH